MDFDDVLVEIGEFGRYQKTNYILVCLPVMFAAANSLSYIFTAGIPNYRCYIPECDNLENSTYYNQWLEYTVPGKTDENGVFNPEQCLKYKLKNTESLNTTKCSIDLFLKSKQIECSEWVFDNSEKTIVQEWNITCRHNAWKLALVGTIHFAGLVVGTVSSGFLADKFGRKIVFIVCIVFMSITGILQGLAWDYDSFLTFAFLNAVGTSGVYPLAFIIGVEMVGPKKREMSCIVLNYFYAIGEAFVGLFAWIFRDWHLLQYGLSAPPILFILYYWFVPESVRWLLVKNQHKKAGKIIKKAAKINKKKLPDTLLATFENHHLNQVNNEDVYFVELSEKNSKKGEIKKTVIQTLKSKILLGRLFVLLYVWVVNAFVYYGLSLNSTSLVGNKYINFILVCLVEIPGYTFAWIAMNKFGRRCSLASSLLLCAFTCAAGGFTPESLSWALITLFLIGKLAVTSSFAIIYTHSAELIPTIIRSGGVGCLSTFARFGAMIAPFVPLLGSYYKPLPLLLFGGVSLFAGFTALLLPETFRQKLPDTVEEAENIGKLNVNLE